MRYALLTACIVGLLSLVALPVYASCNVEAGKPCPDECISLNTHIPFIGHCISKSVDPDINNTSSANVFVKLTGGLMRILMTTVIIVAFMSLLVGGFLIALGGLSPEQVKKGKNLIIKVVIGLLLLGASGIILNLINPNFFGTSS